jgi:hypothetical protein
VAGAELTTELLSSLFYKGHGVDQATCGDKRNLMVAISVLGTFVTVTKSLTETT